MRLRSRLGTTRDGVLSPELQLDTQERTVSWEFFPYSSSLNIFQVMRRQLNERFLTYVNSTTLVFCGFGVPAETSVADLCLSTACRKKMAES